MCATALVPGPTVTPEATLNPVLTPIHDAWMADADRFLFPVTDPNATFWERWAAVRYAGDLFPERFELEQALLMDLHPFLTPELNTRLWLQVDRLSRLLGEFNRLGGQRQSARELAHTARELLEALRLWYAEIEFAADGIRRGDVSREGTELLTQLNRARCGWADACT